VVMYGCVDLCLIMYVVNRSGAKSVGTTSCDFSGFWLMNVDNVLENF
jgi:hypothetical protein